MSNAISSEIAFVEGGGCCPSQSPTPPPAPGCCPDKKGALVYRSVWDRLCQQLFGATPPDIDTEQVLPDVDVWKTGVILVEDTIPATFTIVTDDTDYPKAGDVIEYKGCFYVIGKREETILDGVYEKPSDLKFQIKVTATGFDQGTDDYDLDLYVNDNLERSYDQSDVIEDAQGNYYLLISTDDMNTGRLKLVITAHVPDPDFPSEYRKEVETVILGTLIDKR